MFKEGHLRIEKGLTTSFDTNEFSNNYFSFDKNNSYILLFNDIIYGFYNLMKYNDNVLVVDYALVKSYRGRNLGNEFLDIIIDYVFKNNLDFKKILLLIPYKNIASIKIATNNEFKIDYDLMDRISEENSSYIPYVKDNPYYKTKVLKKDYNVV